MADTAIFRDFTKKRPPVYFNIGDEKFHCFKALGPRRLQRAINAFREVQTQSKEGVTEGNVGQLLERITNTMIFFLKPESYKRFDALVRREDEDELENDIEDVADDDYEPVDVYQLIDILTWLLGDVYGARPTKPSSDSSTTSESDDGGTSSTAGAQLEESIPSS